MKTCCNSSFWSSLQTSKCIYNLIYTQLKAHNKKGVRCSDGRVVVRSVGRWAGGRMAR